MEKAPALLKLEGVSKRFGALVVLTDISMSVAKGELRAVIGPNGAGKTTLFNLISGFFPASEGRIVFDDTEINGITPEQLARRGIIRTFQITEVFPTLSVFENYRIAVEAALGLSGSTRLTRQKASAVARKVDELLALTGQADKAYRIAGELAHGDQRVVEVGLTLAREPELLLLDEPTAGMGDEETERMVRLIRSLHHERGVTMLFIEHDMDIIFGVADRITVLNNGVMLADGTPAEIGSNEQVQRAYLGGER